MNGLRPQLALPTCLRSGIMVLGLLLVASSISAAPCDRMKSQKDTWVLGRVNALIIAARAAYEKDSAQTAYERLLDGITLMMRQCGLVKENDFVKRYPEFVDYVTTLSLGRQPDHELGFTVPDKVYFAETRPYVEIPDFLLRPAFLGAVSRNETLKQAKA